MSKVNIALFLAVMLQAVASQGNVTVEAELQGNIQIRIQDERHFRHSADCYWKKKGPELSDRGSQEVALSGGLQAGDQRSFSWTSAIGSPFGREVRRLTLTTVEVGSMIKLSLSDSYGYRDEQTSSSECGHIDGITRPDKASVRGTIKVHYTVPEGVWAIQLVRLGRGVFQRSNQRPMSGILNPGYDDSTDVNEILWTEPGAIITQEVVIPDSIPGSTDLGGIDLDFQTVGQKITDPAALLIELNNLQKLVKNVSNGMTVNGPKFLHAMATVSRSSETLEVALKKQSTRFITSLSRDLFDYAQALNKEPKLGLPLKTMAAITAYELSIHLLKEMSPYCDEVDIVLPISGKNVHTIGLRAAGFWLQRALARVANYGWEHYEALVRELAIMEVSGATYDQVMKNEALRIKINKASNVLVESLDPSASPFRRSTKDVQTTMEHFGSIGGDEAQTQDLIIKMKELGQLEAEFVRQFFTVLKNFKHGNQTPISVRILVEDLQKLQDGQKTISLSMTSNIRLLSASDAPTTESAFSVMVDALSHQIGIFQEDVEGVPYFSLIRASYVNKYERKPLIDKIGKCVLLEDEK